MLDHTKPSLKIKSLDKKLQKYLDFTGFKPIETGWWYDYCEKMENTYKKTVITFTQAFLLSLIVLKFYDKIITFFENLTHFSTKNIKLTVSLVFAILPFIILLAPYIKVTCVHIGYIVKDSIKKPLDQKKNKYIKVTCLHIGYIVKDSINKFLDQKKNKCVCIVKFIFFAFFVVSFIITLIPKVEKGQVYVVMISTVFLLMARLTPLYLKEFFKFLQHSVITFLAIYGFAYDISSRILNVVEITSESINDNLYWIFIAIITLISFILNPATILVKSYLQSVHPKWILLEGKSFSAIPIILIVLGIICEYWVGLFDLGLFFAKDDNNAKTLLKTYLNIRVLIIAFISYFISLAISEYWVNKKYKQLLTDLGIMRKEYKP